jgi:ATP-dependent protease ClpP protease subunit
MGEYTGKDYDTIKRDFDRNKWLFAEEAVAYGCADKVQDRAPERLVSKRDRDEDNGDDKD